jgi:hypothetical protein
LKPANLLSTSGYGPALTPLGGTSFDATWGCCTTEGAFSLSYIRFIYGKDGHMHWKRD